MADIFRSASGERERGTEPGGGSGSRPVAGARPDDGSPDDVVDGEVVDGDVVGDDAVDPEVVDAVNLADVAEAIQGSIVDDDPVTVALAQRDEFLDSLRRLQAEFENYKKRVAKQQTDQTARAALSLVEKLLPVLDTLDLATEHLGDAESADGRALVAASSQLRDVLAKEGLERIDPAGEAFDPNAHEAVGQLPAEEPAGSGDGAAGGTADGPVPPEPPSAEPVVGQVMRPGYRWRGVVVRPAMVLVRG